MSTSRKTCIRYNVAFLSCGAPIDGIIDFAANAIGDHEMVITLIDNKVYKLLTQPLVLFCEAFNLLGHAVVEFLDTLVFLHGLSDHVELAQCLFHLSVE